MLNGNFRSVFFVGKYAIKIARGFEGIVANISEMIIYLLTRKKNKKYLARTYFSLGIINIQEKCYYASKSKVKSFMFKTFRCHDLYWTILNDSDHRNVGKSKLTGKYVKIDYADHWIIAKWLRNICNLIFKKKCYECKSTMCIGSDHYLWKNQKGISNELKQ